MKKIVLLITSVFLSLNIMAQCYTAAYNSGKRYEKKGQYYKAIIKYQAAQICPDKPPKNDINRRIAFCAKKLNDLTQSAVSSQKDLKKVKNELETTQKQLDSLSNIIKKQNNIVSKVFFYDNKYALAFSDGRFGYMDTTGKVIIECKYIFATPFERKTGFAKVVYNSDLMLIDTSGTEYTLAENIENINKQTQAVIISNTHTDLKKIFDFEQLQIIISRKSMIKEIPENFVKMQNLRYLDLSRNSIKEIPQNIDTLQNLEVLDLSYNQITTFPDSLANLKNLKKLILIGNKISPVDKQRLIKMLPDCRIIFANKINR